MLVNKCRYLFLFFFFTNKPLGKSDICLKKKNPTYVVCLCGFMAYLYYLFLCRIIYLLKISFGVKFPLTGYHAPIRLSFKIESEFSKDGL